MTFSRETITLDQLLESADVISSQGFYDAREVNLILEDKLPQNTSLLPAEISHPEFAQFLTESLNVFAKPTEELAALEIPNRQQLVLPIILENGHMTSVIVNKDKNDKISQVTYFDPVGLNTPFDTLEPHSQDKYLEYSSIPTHVIEAIEQGLKVSRNDIAITTNRIQGTFFNKDKQRHTYAADSGPLTTYFLNEVAHGNIKVDVSPLNKMAGLTKKTADGSFSHIGSYDPKKAEAFTKARRINDLGKLQDIFEEKLQESGKEISESEAKRFKIVDPSRENAVEKILKKDRKKRDDVPSIPQATGLNVANVVTRALFVNAALLNLPELKNSDAIAEHNNLRALSNDIEVQHLPRPKPSFFPTSAKSAYPTSQTTLQPNPPSVQPTSRPTSQPSSQPSVSRSAQPSEQPSEQPFAQPSEQPSSQPSERPSSQSNLLTTTSNSKTVSRQVIAAIAGGGLGAIGETLLRTTGDGGGVSSFLEALYKLDKSYTAPQRALSLESTVKHVVLPAVVLVGSGGLAGYFIHRNPHAEKLEDKDSSKLKIGHDVYKGTHSSIKFSDPVKNGETFLEEGLVDPAIGVAAFWSGVAAIATAAVCIKSCQGRSERKVAHSPNLQHSTRSTENFLMGI